MTKRNAALYFSLLAITISGVTVLAAAANRYKSATPDARVAAESEVVLTTPPSIGYVLKEYEGQLALFREYNEKPYRKLDFDVALLSDEDKLLMSTTGITVKTEKELRRLIEDYTG